MDSGVKLAQFLLSSDQQLDAPSAKNGYDNKNLTITVGRRNILNLASTNSQDTSSAFAGFPPQSSAMRLIVMLFSNAMSILLQSILLY